MNIRKILAAASAAVIALACLTSCGKSGSSSEKGDNGVKIESGDFSKTAVEVVADMKVGWNLGNQLDSVCSTPHESFMAEESWGNPRVGKELIDSVKAAGFNTVRIPVTYINHFGDAPDYTIDEDWLDRVKEVVDYVIDNDMYAIINIHHDGSTNVTGKWIDIAADDQTQVLDQFEKMWTQIAEKFKGYDEHLIFESMNEIMEDGNYNAPKNENTYKNINALNQKFVDTVRKTGGNNDKRYLLVPGYNTNIGFTAEGAFEEGGFIPPTDTAENKLMISVHFYDPWTYAGEGSTDQWGYKAEKGKADNWGQEDFLTDRMDLLKTTFVDKGYGVIIGECGAVYQAEELEPYREYYIEYMTQAAVSRGMCPVFWDNGSRSSGTEAFGLFNRSMPYDQLYPNVIEKIMKAANGGDYRVEF